MWSTIRPRLDRAHAAVISGATGIQPATSEERDFLASQGLAVRATATHLGHGLEPQFPANIALAAAALGTGRLFAPCAPSERPMDAALRQVVVTSIGHWRGEGLALVEAAG
jgi:3-oxoacyl-[acyl-carrier-protein] synthase II